MRLQPPVGTREAVDAAIARGLVTIPAKVFENGAKVEKRTIRKWRERVDPFPFDEAPDAHLWAHRTGGEWGLVILDFDTESDNGPAAMDALERSGLRPHRRSGSGGFHVEVEHPGWKVKTVAAVLPGVDVRGDGGVVYFAGISHKGVYEPVADHPPYAVEEVPDWLRRATGLLEPPTPKARVLRQPYDGDDLGTATGLRFLGHATKAIRDARSGTGNDTLNKMAYAVAGLVASGHLDDGYARDEVESAGEDRWDGDVAAVLEAAWSVGLDAPWEPDSGVEEWDEDGSSDRDITVVDVDDDADRWHEVTGPVRITARDVAREDFESRTLTIGDILWRRPPRWLIPGLLQESSLAELVSPPSAGKSLLAVQWAVDLAVQGKRVLYAAAEGMGGYGGRLRALAKHRGIEPDDLPGGFFFYSDVVNLADEDAVEDLVGWTKRNGPWDLIVIDTLARAIPGLEENSAKEMGAAVHAAERLKAGRGSVLLVHHSGHGTERGRGSSVVLAAMDNVIHCFPNPREHNGRDGQPLRVKVTAQKLKDGRASAAMYFRAEEVDLGAFTSVVLVSDGPEDREAKYLTEMETKVRSRLDEGQTWTQARGAWTGERRIQAKEVWDRIRAEAASGRPRWEVGTPL